MGRRKYPDQLGDDDRGERWRVSGIQIMAGVHFTEDCSGRCVLHNPSVHKMREWPLVWDGDFHNFWRVCGHGVAHTDPDDDKRDSITFNCPGDEVNDFCCRGTGVILEGG